jgi:hypothetical protein
VFEVIFGVTKLLPEPNAVEKGLRYQFKLPVALAVKVTGPLPHFTAPKDTGVGGTLTVINEGFVILSVRLAQPIALSFTL